MGTPPRTALILSLLIWMPLLIAPSAAAEAEAQDTRYLPSLVVIGVACGAEDHSLVPDTFGPDEILANPVGWAFSGEPECAYADALNKGSEALGEERTPWGLGAAAHRYVYEDVGSLAIASTEDLVFGAGHSYLRLRADGNEEEARAEGCGTQSIVLPDAFSHWQGWPLPPSYWWAFVDEVGVDEDLEVCFASAGTLHGTWGA